MRTIHSCCKRRSSPFCASVLLIAKGPTNVNIVQMFQMSHLSTSFRNSGFHLFRSKTNQNSVRYSVSKSYFTNIAAQNVNKAFCYTKDSNYLFSEPSTLGEKPRNTELKNTGIVRQIKRMDNENSPVVLDNILKALGFVNGC